MPWRKPNEVKLASRNNAKQLVVGQRSTMRLVLSVKNKSRNNAKQLVVGQSKVSPCES